MPHRSHRPTPVPNDGRRPNAAGTLLYGTVVLLLACLQLLPVGLASIGAPTPPAVDAVLILVGGGLSPLWAMLTAGAVTLGWPATRQLIRSGLRLRGPTRWYLAAATVPALTLVAAGAVTGARPTAEVSMLALATQVVLIAPVFALAENLGWRTWLQQGLQTLLGIVGAGTVVGLVWGAWHLPRFVPAAQTPQAGVPIASFLVLVVTFSVLLAFVYRASENSVLPVATAHVSFNASAQLLIAGDPAGSAPLLLTAAALFAALTIAARNWAGQLAGTGLDPTRTSS